MKVLKILIIYLGFLCFAVSTGKADDATTSTSTEKDSSTIETYSVETDESQAKDELRTHWQESRKERENLYTTGLHSNVGPRFSSTGLDADKPSDSLESIKTGKNVTGSDLSFPSVLSNSLSDASNNHFSTSLEEVNAMNDMHSSKPKVPGQDNLLSQELKGLNQHTSLSDSLSSKFSIPDQGDSYNELVSQKLNSPKQGNSFKYLSSQNRNSPYQGTSLNAPIAYKPDASDQIISLNDLVSPKLNGPHKSNSYNNYFVSQKSSQGQDSSLNDRLSQNLNDDDQETSFNNLFYSKHKGPGQGKLFNNMIPQELKNPDKYTIFEILSKQFGSQSKDTSFDDLFSPKLRGLDLLSQKLNSLDQSPSKNDIFSQNDDDQETAFNNLFYSKHKGPGQGKLFNTMIPEELKNPEKYTIFEILSKQFGSESKDTSFDDLFSPKLRGLDLLSQKLNSLDESPSKNDIFSQKLIRMDEGSFKNLLYDDQDVHSLNSPQDNGMDLSILSAGDNNKLNLLYSTQMSPISGLTPCDNSNALANIVNNLLGMLLSEMGGSPNNVNVLIDSINSNIESNPNGIFDTKLYPLLKRIESSTSSGASSLQNRLKRDLKSKIIFKTDIPRISEPDCKEAFLKLMALAYKSYIEASKLPDCKLKNHVIPDNPYNPEKVILPSIDQEHDNLVNSNDYKLDVNVIPETITYKSVTDQEQNVADESQDDSLDHLLQTLQQADTNRSTSPQKYDSLQQLAGSLLEESGQLGPSFDEQVRQKIDDQIEKELSSILSANTSKPEKSSDEYMNNKPKTPIQYILKSNESWFEPINNSPESSSSIFPKVSLNNDTKNPESFPKYLEPSSHNNYLKNPALGPNTVGLSNPQTGKINRGEDIDKYLEPRSHNDLKNPTVGPDIVSLSNPQTGKINRGEDIDNVYSITLKDAFSNLGSTEESYSEPKKDTELQSFDLPNLSESGHLSPNPNSDTDNVQVRNNHSLGLRESPEDLNDENRKYYPGIFYTGNQPPDFSAVLSSPRFGLLNPQAKNLVIKKLLAHYGNNKNVNDRKRNLLALWLRNPNNSKLPQIIQKNNINIYVTPSKQLKSPDYNPQIGNLLKTILGYVELLANKHNRDDQNSELLNNIHSMVTELVTNPELRQNIVVLLRVYANWASKLGVDGTMSKNIKKLIQYVENNLLKHDTNNLVQDCNTIIETIIQHFQNNIRKILPNSSDQQIVLNQIDHWINYAAENGIDLTKTENLNILLQYLNEFITKIQHPDSNSERNIVSSTHEPDFSILTDIAYLLKDMGLRPEEIVLVTSKVRQYIIDAASRGIDLKIPENFKELADFIETIIETILSKPAPTPSIFDTNLLKAGPTDSAFDAIPTSSGPYHSEFDRISSTSDGSDSVVDTDSVNAYPTTSIPDPILFNPGSTHSVLKPIYSNSPTDTILETIPSRPDLVNVNTLSTSYVTDSSNEMVIPSENSPIGLQSLSPSIRKVLIDHIDSIIRKQDSKAEILRLLENYLTNAADNGVDVNKSENLNDLILYLNGLILQFVHDSPDLYRAKEISVNPAIINYFTHLIYDLVPDPEQRRIVTSEVSGLLKKYLENGVNLSIEKNLNRFIWDVVNIAKNASRPLDGSFYSSQYVTEPDTVEILFRFKHKIAIKGLKEPVVSPNSYVKYTIPFQVFTKNLRDIMLRTPSLRSDPDRLQKELESKSDIIEVSPELQGLPKSHLVRILTHDGAFVDAKVPVDTRRSNFRSAVDVASDAEFKEKIRDLDRILNKIRRDDTEIGKTTGKATAKSKKTFMDPKTLLTNDNFNPLEFNADNPFYLHLNNKTATVNHKDLTRRSKLIR